MNYLPSLFTLFSSVFGRFGLLLER